MRAVSILLEPRDRPTSLADTAFAQSSFFDNHNILFLFTQHYDFEYTHHILRLHDE